MGNVFEYFSRAAARFPTRTAVELHRRGDVEVTTYVELAALATQVAHLLQQTGVTLATRCAILADNDARWCGAYFGILRLGAIAVPLDTAYQPSQVRTVLADCGATVLLTSPKFLATAQDAVRDLPGSPCIVLLHGSADGTTGIDAGPWPDHEEGLPAIPTDAPFTAVILYTSGTTSDPKGVMLTHGNLLAERDAVFEVVTIHENDSVLGVLPLFHALAQIANLLIPLTVGACIVFMETVTSSEMVRVLAERRITAFCVVPQFYYLIHQRVMERVAAAPWVVRLTFRAWLALNGVARRWFRLNFGRWLFGRVHAAVGRSMRILVTGGSRFDPRIGRDLFNMGFNIIQAYGLTECSGAATVTRPGDPHIESAGQPLAGVDIRIKDEPADGRDRDREYPDGEVLIKGPIVMSGYYNRPDANAVTLQDSWLHSGDLGYLDRQGRLHITGRKKDVIVLASGKNIYPEELEAVYLRSPLIKDICVMGVAHPDEPSAERLHAIVVPNLDLIRERRVVNLREVIRFDVESLSLQLPHHKRVLSFDIWQADLPRTTTRKLKRHAIERAYHERAVNADQPTTDVEWSEAEQIWAADPHVQRVLEHIRPAAKPGRAFTPGANLELDLGLDSMERVELLTSLEQAFGVDIPEEEKQCIYTVRDLVDALRGVADGTVGATGVALDPWARLLAEDPDDPILLDLLRPRPLSTACTFLVARTWNLCARLLMGLRVSGRTHLPRDGAYVISPNHQSYLDAFLLVGTLPYRTFRRLFFVGASEYFATPLLRRIARLINVVPVDPDANLVRSMQAGAFGLRHGKVLVLFPEGERSPDGTVRTFKKGASILATHIGVPIVPVAIHGVYDIWPRGKSLQWSQLFPFAGARARFSYGSPVSPSGTAGATDPERYARLTARVRDAVGDLWAALDRHAGTSSP